MKKTYRVALMIGLMAMSAPSATAAEIHAPTDEMTTRVLVMNNFRTEVRVYIEDAHGKLHNMGRLRRGSLADFMVPEELSGGEFRVKVYPAGPPGTPLFQDIGIKTNPLDSSRDRQVRVWVEADLTRSIVEIARG